MSSGISRRLESRICRDYAADDAEQVIAFLSRVAADHANSRQSEERLQAAAFILLKGDVNLIPRVRLLMRDWRDGLVWAGLGQPDWPDRLNAMFGPAA